MSSLNPETIAALKALDDGDGFFAEMVNTFLDNAKVTFEQLYAAQAANDIRALERAAHKLRGAASTIGAQNLMAMCEALETSARAEHVPDVAGSVAAIETELQQVRLALQAEMQN
ncbi:MULTISPECIES: Hpt domain-containing protein [Chloracidobacterium]|jgi:HPt (histidine-containing phosphotransfer) domain-containing protein|uniref:HPt domain protein n=1 Tax=Chloracidobacterium thermophilum (strain B) TaxID=981222 RepID=G2LL49_CHLTF|nr:MULTISPECIES: Hpt domain-containing protein [Chloracidobacterium]AEP13725.1 HPt domain protein [Chloracidobacterium thermophilum B]QUV80187.1 Hpt domain-containing protein [Chloracidobacterium thermophilum]QUV83278.1 Hpt domain-containing protein [Chloracidobacterium sp. D]